MNNDEDDEDVVIDCELNNDGYYESKNKNQSTNNHKYKRKIKMTKPQDYIILIPTIIIMLIIISGPCSDEVVEYGYEVVESENIILDMSPKIEDPPSEVMTILSSNKMEIDRVSFYNPWDVAQTDDSPGICAWGWKYKPGDHIAAVSRDLEDDMPNGSIIKVYGLPQCLPDVYTVRDRMNKRWDDTIDLAIPMEMSRSLSKRIEICNRMGIFENLKIEVLSRPEEN